MSRMNLGPGLRLVVDFMWGGGYIYFCWDFGCAADGDETHWGGHDSVKICLQDRYFCDKKSTES